MKTQFAPRPGNVYRAQLVGAIVMAGSGALTLDANDFTANFARELEWIDQKLQRTEHAPLKSQELMKWEDCGGPNVELVTWQKVTELGEAQFIGRRTTELPTVDVVGNEYSRQVKNLGVKYSYTVFEVKNSAASPTIRLPEERKRAAYNTVMRKHDKTALIGDANEGWTGFFNDPNVPLVTPITGGWLTATGEQIIADLSKLIWSIFNATIENHEADTLILPSVFAGVMDKPISTGADKSLRAYILETFTQLKKIHTSHYLNTAGAGGIKRVVAYKNDGDVIRYGANDVFEEEAPQRDDLNIDVPCYGRTSGTQIKLPLAIAFMDMS